MKKILLVVFALLVCLSIVGCNKGWESTVTDYSGEVSSNGGFLVEKGDYVYYINGVSDNTADNTFGTPVKGAIVRSKKSDLGKADATAEVVVPEIVYSNQMSNDNGLFIFGDYIYYATPCNEKNKDGVIRSSETEFMRTKLDGTDSKVIATINSNNAPFRFTQLGDKVYLVVYTVNADNANVLKAYNAENGEMVKESKVVSSYAFSTDLNDKYIYYSTPIRNEALDSDESFNAVRRFSVDGSEDVEVLNGAGTYSDQNNGVGIAGVSFGIVKYTGSQLYLTEALVQTSTVSVYRGINTADIKTAEEGGVPATKLNYNKLVTLDNGSSLASSIFASSSIYINLNNIVYFDSTYGIFKYDYSKADNAVGFGREKVYYNEDMLGWTFKFINNGVAYFTDSNNVYYSFALNEVVDLSTGEIKNADVKPKRLNYFDVNTSWYQPEFVGNFMLVAVSTEPYYNYVYAIDLTKADGLTEEQIKDFEDDMAKVDREHILSRVQTRVGIVSEADKTAYNTFMDEKYPAKEESSDSNEASKS